VGDRHENVGRWDDGRYEGGGVAWDGCVRLYGLDGALCVGYVCLYVNGEYLYEQDVGLFEWGVSLCVNRVNL